MSEMWNSVAGAWEANADFVDGHLAGATAAMLDAAGVDVGSKVLDMACGAGGAGLAAARRVGPSGSVILADDAPEMLAAAGRRSDGLGQVSTLLCDQGEIPLSDGTVDCVIIRHGLMFAEYPAAAVAEGLRVTKPGGRYAAMTWGARSKNPWLGLTLDAVGEEFGIPFPPAEVLGPFALDDPDRLEIVLEEGGADDVSVREFSTPAAFESVDAWWNLVLQLAGPLAIALEGMEPGVRESIRQRAVRMAGSAATETPDGISLQGSVLIASGSRP